MGLSYELISEFVKITNDKKEQPKEGIVYATVVGSGDEKYIKIDGSDLLTPADTTADIEDGERVTVMIKDHKATVTGNITNPSASGSSVTDISNSVTSISDRVGTFELVVAEKISVEELEAYKITVNELIADKATIQDLTATNAEIENLKVKNAEIENLVAEKATITDLEAVNATIENLKVKDAEIENAVIENLEATTADIKILNADFAQIKTLVNGNLTSDNILSFNLTSEKVTVDDAFIKDAMIDTISAGKINAGRINTNYVSIGSEDGGMIITGSTQQFTDKNGNVRIQIGKDASGDFTFILYGEDGTGQILNQNGITATAIGDGLIVNNMVSDSAAISGGKLDISSVITEINSNTSTTINSSKVYIDSQGQSLEVAFSSLKTQVDSIQEITISGDLNAIIEQVNSNTTQINANKESINTLISEDTVIKTQISDLNDNLVSAETELTAKYTTLNQSLDGFKTTVADTYATKSTVNDLSSNLSTNYSTTSVMNSAIDQKANEITASISSTYAKQTELNDLNTNLTNNYYTILQTDSAINVAKEEINLNVSSIYETKEEVQNKIENISIGGANLWSETTYVEGALLDGVISDYWLAPHMSNPEYFEIRNHTHIVYQVWNPNGVTNTENYNRFCFYDESKTYIDRINIPFLTGEKYQSFIFEIPNNVSYVRFGVVTDVPGGGYDTSLKFKIEFGNKPTEWIPNAIDTDNNISEAKSEAIASANDTLNTTIANYYTKTQTDSAINVAKEEINLNVSSRITETKTEIQNEIDNIKIGGTNLVNKKTDLMYGYISTSDGSIVDSGILNNNQDFYTTNYIFVKEGIPVTFTSYPKQDVASSIINAVNIHVYSLDKTWLGNTSEDITNTNEIATTTFIATSDCYVRFSARGFNDYNHMAEFASKPSEWSPSPGDVDSDITYIQTETQVLKENIASLEINTNSISASVMSLEETITSSVDGLSKDIEMIQNQVNATMTAEDVKLEIQNSMANGVDRVTTSTGFTFNDEGLKIDKSDSEMSTQITEDGMTVYKNDEAMLTANNEGVKAKNLHATTYLIIGKNSRMEDFTCDGRACTAVFWIGSTS